MVGSVLSFREGDPGCSPTRLIKLAHCWHAQFSQCKATGIDDSVSNISLHPGNHTYVKSGISFSVSCRSYFINSDSQRFN